LGHDHRGCVDTSFHACDAIVLGNAMSRHDARMGIGPIWAAVIAAMVVVGLGQAASYLVLLLLGEFGGLGGRILITPGLSLVVIFNRGIAYGVLQGFPRTVVMTTIGAIGFAFFACALLGSGKRATAVAFGCICGGVLCNIIDRLRLDGAVLDYIMLSHGAFTLSVFNLADVAIWYGLMLLLVDQYFVAGSAYEPPRFRIGRSASPRFRPPP